MLLGAQAAPLSTGHALTRRTASGYRGCPCTSVQCKLSLSLTRPVFYRDWTRTIFLRGDDEDYTMTTRGRMMERLQVILAGRAAEEVAYEIPSSYSISDLKVAWSASKQLLSHAVPV